jgi:hypothetical protein
MEELERKEESINYGERRAILRLILLFEGYLHKFKLAARDYGRTNDSAVVEKAVKHAEFIAAELPEIMVRTRKSIADYNMENKTN